LACQKTRRKLALAAYWFGWVLPQPTRFSS
jgi:hypothetical protein